MSRALEGHIHTYSVGVLSNGVAKLLLPDVDNSGRANAGRGLEPILIPGRSRYDGAYPFGCQQLQAKQSYRSWSRDQNRILRSYVGDFLDGLHHGRKWLTH